MGDGHRAFASMAWRRLPVNFFVLNRPGRVN